MQNSNFFFKIINFLFRVVILKKMGVPVVSYPIYRVVRILGFAVVALVLTWTVHYRGGLALISSNKDLIFNVIIILFFLVFPFNFAFR